MGEMSGGMSVSPGRILPQDFLDCPYVHNGPIHSADTVVISEDNDNNSGNSINLHRRHISTAIDDDDDYYYYYYYYHY